MARVQTNLCQAPRLINEPFSGQSKAASVSPITRLNYASCGQLEYQYFGLSVCCSSCWTRLIIMYLVCIKLLPFSSVLEIPESLRPLLSFTAPSHRALFHRPKSILNGPDFKRILPNSYLKQFLLKSSYLLMLVFPT